MVFVSLWLSDTSPCCCNEDVDHLHMPYVYRLSFIVVLSGCRITQTGDVEYVLQDAQAPHLFVVRQEQKTRAGDMPTAAYYIIDGTVYQSPSLHSVFHSRIVRDFFPLLVTNVTMCLLISLHSHGTKEYLHHQSSHMQSRCSFKMKETLEMLRQDLNPIDGTLSQRPKDMYEKLKRLEALQQKEYALHTEACARSDHIIMSLLQQQQQQMMALHSSHNGQ